MGRIRQIPLLYWQEIHQGYLATSQRVLFRERWRYGDVSVFPEEYRVHLAGSALQIRHQPTRGGPIC